MNRLNRVVCREEFSKASSIKGKVKSLSVGLVSMLLLSCGGDHAAHKPQQVSGPVSSLRASIAVDYPETEAEAARFLMRASFGPTEAEIEAVMRRGYSDWMLTQLSLPVIPYLPRIASGHGTTSDSIDATRSASLFWSNAVGGQDQLRQRAAFAMSEIMVVSAFSGSIRGRGRMIASYMDVMQDAAFGNFRDTMEAVTYNPTMGIYLTYLGNQAFNSFTGAVPDENYARELMQLFTIGLVELNQDGTPQLDGTTIISDMAKAAR